MRRSAHERVRKQHDTIFPSEPVFSSGLSVLFQSPAEASAAGFGENNDAANISIIGMGCIWAINKSSPPMLDWSWVNSF